MRLLTGPSLVLSGLKSCKNRDRYGNSHFGFDSKMAALFIYLHQLKPKLQSAAHNARLELVK